MNQDELIRLIQGYRKDLPRRYCEFDISRVFPCTVGWGSIDADGVKTCHDDPVEGNCRFIIRDVKVFPTLEIRLVGGRSYEIRNPKKQNDNHT